MKNPVTDFVEQLRLGQPQSFEGLTVIPLLSEHEADVPFVTLDEALARGLIDLEEVSEAGSVNELKVVNKADTGVFILDGEELVGAKQNRIANASFVVPAGKQTVIDVSCIERGRWAYNSQRFSTSGSVFASTGRRAKMEDVTGELHVSGRFRSDQGRVWKEVDGYLDRTGTISHTDSFVDVHHALKDKVDAAVAAFRSVPGQVGALVSVAGRLIGLDAFGRPAAWLALFPKLVRSYAVEALGAPAPASAPDNPGPAGDAPSFLRQVASAPMEQFESVGEGTDIRARAGGVMASALVVRDQVLHLAAFPTPAMAGATF